MDSDTQELGVAVGGEVGEIASIGRQPCFSAKQRGLGEVLREDEDVLRVFQCLRQLWLNGNNV
jgi:hypothetical protein